MKKFLFLPLLLIILILGSNNVYASGDAYLSNYYSKYPDYVDFSSVYSSIIDNLISNHNNNVSDTFTNYIILTNSSLTRIILLSIDTDYIFGEFNNIVFLYPNTKNWFSYVYDIPTNTYSSSSSTSTFYAMGNTLPYSSNFTLKFTSSCISSTPSSCYSSLTIPSYSNLQLDVSYPQFDISDGDELPTYESLTTGTTPTGFTSVNLSSYDYIVLSLKDYTQEPFNTTIYTQGSLCLTPVYNYGMQQKQEFYPGYQVQGCTEVYSSDTPVNVYIIQSDLTNHAVYYIKQQPNTPTTLKIPTSVFDITYIITNNTDPQVVIGGRSYPVIPFSDLTDTANISTDTGYISGQTCALGDVNCQATAMGMDISDLFTSPLTLLKTLWGSITSIFTIITAFINVLPPTLQVFLYTSFMLGVILGIIKIIL